MFGKIAQHTRLKSFCDHAHKKKISGIFFRDGESWHEQRRFHLRNLRDFGFGRRFDSFEKENEIQIAQLIDIVKNGPKYDHEKVGVILCVIYCTMLKFDQFSQKFAGKGRLLMPYAFGPTVGACFVMCMLNEAMPREHMADIYEYVQRMCT